MKTPATRIAAQLTCTVALALSSLWLLVPRADAFKISQTTCGGDRYRDPGGWAVKEMCQDPPGFPGLPNATDPNSNSFAAARAGMLSAHFMWVREGTSDAELFVDGNAGCGDGSGFRWFDTTNEKNNVWWESIATVRSHGNGCGSAAACCAVDEALCIPLLNTSTHIIAADIAVGNDDVFSVVNQDTVVDCFRIGVNHEWMWLHEIGHAYGLAHDAATVSVMRTGSSNVMRNCHVFQNFHHYPFPDDIAGLMKHHKGFSGTKRNWAGTPWIRSGGEDSVPEDTHTIASNTMFVAVEATLHSYYSSGGWPRSRLFLVPISTKPTFNNSTKTWTLNHAQLGFVINHETDGTPTFGIESRKVNLGATFGGPSLPVGTYRVWAMVDPTGLTTETDEGDNVFPTNIVLNRTAG